MLVLVMRINNDFVDRLAVYNDIDVIGSTAHQTDPPEDTLPLFAKFSKLGLSLNIFSG